MGQIKADQHWGGLGLNPDSPRFGCLRLGQFRAREPGCPKPHYRRNDTTDRFKGSGLFHLNQRGLHVEDAFDDDNITPKCTYTVVSVRSVEWFADTSLTMACVRNTLVLPQCTRVLRGSLSTSRVGSLAWLSNTTPRTSATAEPRLSSLEASKPESEGDGG